MDVRVDVLQLLLLSHHAGVLELARVLCERFSDGFHPTEGFRSLRPDLIPGRVSPRLTRLVPIDGAPRLVNPLHLTLIYILFYV